MGGGVSTIAQLFICFIIIIIRKKIIELNII